MKTVLPAAVILLIGVATYKPPLCFGNSLHANASANQNARTNEHKDAVHEEIIIKATPEVVWQSMQKQRRLDPDSLSCKSIETAGKAIVEQRFRFPSPLGNAECTLQLREIPAERIDFNLIESEDLREMEGSWILRPIGNGETTKLVLSSYVEPRKCVPRILTNGVISHRAKRNLAIVKRLAEGNL